MCRRLLHNCFCFTIVLNVCWQAFTRSGLARRWLSSLESHSGLPTKLGHCSTLIWVRARPSARDQDSHQIRLQPGELFVRDATCITQCISRAVKLPHSSIQVYARDSVRGNLLQCCLTVRPILSFQLRSISNFRADSDTEPNSPLPTCHTRSTHMYRVFCSSMSLKIYWLPISRKALLVAGPQVCREAPHLFFGISSMSLATGRRCHGRHPWGRLFLYSFCSEVRPSLSYSLEWMGDHGTH